jgi:NADH-quinone oxidoreductase subunit J
MNMYDIIFYLFGAVTIISAFFVVTSRNIIYSAFYLLFTFFGVAGLYILLGADFVAVVQLIVYVGGILILLLFGVMLTNKITSVNIKTGTLQIIPAVIAMIAFMYLLISTLLETGWKTISNPVDLPSTQSLGMLLITQYAIVFELLGILLLIALIGAASMARK